MEIVRGGGRVADLEGEKTIGLNGNSVVQVLQFSFNQKELLADEQQPIFFEQVGGNDGIGNDGFIFQAEKNNTMSGACALASNDAASNADAPPIADVAHFDRRFDSVGLQFRTTVSDGLMLARQAAPA